MTIKNFLEPFKEGFMFAAGFGLAAVLIIGSLFALLMVSFLIGHYTFTIIGWVVGILGLCVFAGTCKALDSTGWFSSYARFFGL